MNAPSSTRIAGLVTVAATLLLPLTGAWLSGRDLRPLRAFPPPLDIPADYPRWSWFAGMLVFASVAAVWLPFVRSRHAEFPVLAPAAAAPAVSRFPSWGWIAFGWTTVWWVLAWTRFPWFAALQRTTFFPLWLGFVVTLNAWIVQRGRTPTMLRLPARWLALFGFSAAFWWMFEWLNRFAQNWHYLGVEDFGPRAYVVHASLCFSTVLPAVLAMREVLATFPALQQKTERGPRWGWLDRRITGAALLLVALVALSFTGARPQEFYPALWVAPLALLFGCGIVSGRRGVWTELAAGEWQRAAGWALAALACGFFWEMWNLPSAAKWIYTVPYVDRWHVFEMPLLGYAGYLGFGLECALVTEWVIGRERDTR
ncbi:hypothetical protein [Opitutus terrae]|uniref:Small-conductance mechanosensitive channel n=1 Tax=Opitutus terrae (strain DSM 11246 / JCM 15787 / PB90-1) TaxID=452637 RepID=B1ZNC0_OPITP|nr:hypothetical protein [Opitutus terrae]ACB73489.1 hypothetical protein Oter_0198 [Opitutus terrae PB90-1]